MSIILWILFGAVVGWLASIIMKRNGSMGLLGNIVVGIIGSALGGWLSDMLFGWGGVTGFNWRSMLVGVGGSCLLLLIFGGAGRKRNAEQKPHGKGRV